MKFLVILLAAFLPQFAFASCSQHSFTEPSQVNLTGESVMIVTHASAGYDARLSSKRGVEEAIHFAKSKSIPLVYLADNNAASAEHYYIDECAPDYWVFSEQGEIKFDVRAAHLYLVGGHLEVCLSNTVYDVLYAWTKQPRRDLTVTYFMDGIYSNGKEIEQSDPYYKEYISFMSVVTYGRLSGESWPKLTLLETMGLIRNEQRQVEYLERILPQPGRVIPADYRIEIKLNDSPVRIVQPGHGARPPVLRFDFVDSAAASAAREFSGPLGS